MKYSLNLMKEYTFILRFCSFQCAFDENFCVLFWLCLFSVSSWGYAIGMGWYQKCVHREVPMQNPTDSGTPRFSTPQSKKDVSS